MQLLDHVSIAVRDLARAKPFYRAVMAALDAREAYDEPGAIGFGARNAAGDDAHSYLSVFESADAQASARRHVCFRAANASQVRAAHAAGLRAGGTSDGAPGLRPHYHAAYYAAFLLDPESNRVEVVTHRGGG
ncbi:MAG: VOC family protein [Myxococcota bacterium]|jgi:catechol 2,3-dioxygenase-like lactoylglutathione lyase family enzyme